MNIFNKIKKILKECFVPTQENHFEPLIVKDKILFALILLFLLTKVLFSFQILRFQRTSLFAELNAIRIIELTNQIRAQYGLPPVKENPVLDKAAQLKAYDMATNKYFAHFSPTGISPWYWFQQAGYKYHYAGENLAMNFIDSEEVVKAWFNSPSHRENLLNKNYTDIGIAILPGDPQINGLNKPIVVQLFGSPSNKAATNTKTTSTTLNTTNTTLPSQAVLGEEEKPTEIKPTTTIKTPTTTKPNSVTSAIKTTTTIKTQAPTTINPSPTVNNQIAFINPETSSPENLENNSLKTETLNPNNIQLVKELNDERNSINNINRILALIIIALGIFVLIGTISSYKNININFSDVILRIFILIFIGASFLAFKLEAFIGNLLIAS